MKLVYPICCGIDVHKTFLVATIITTEGMQPHYKKRRFSTFNHQILEMKSWLLENNCLDVCMESTGKYWVPVFNLLEDKINVVIANPKWVKAVKGNKDDVKDSKWIGDLFRIGLVKESFIPPKNIRVLREFTRYRSKLVGTKSSEKNRYQNCFTVCNIALDSVVSDMFGKSASSILNYILSCENFDAAYCVTLLKGTLKSKADEVIKSIEGFAMTEEQKIRASLVKEHYDFVMNQIHKIDEQIGKMSEPFESTITLLQTIPGVGRQSAITILSEIGTNMSQFGSSKQLCSWAGLTPSNNQSAGKKKSVKISRAGVYLKPCLVEAAHAAVKSKDTPFYKIKFERISKRRGKKRAIVAIARMILTAVYHMLSTGEVWNPSDLTDIDITPEKHEQILQASLAKAAKLLITYGVISPEVLQSSSNSA